MPTNGKLTEKNGRVILYFRPLEIKTLKLGFCPEDLTDIRVRIISMKKVVTFGEVMARLAAPGYSRLRQAIHNDKFNCAYERWCYVLSLLCVH